jgi:hypothetical protein
LSFPSPSLISAVQTAFSFNTFLVARTTILDSED